jgi:hypothetical protein
MQPSPHTDAHWPPVGSGIWTRWWGYFSRWVLFGLVVHLFQPADDLQGPLWQNKLMQAVLGLSFGTICAVIFTLSENKFNTPRQTWKSWVIVLASWVAGKVIFATGFALWE